MQTLKKLGKLGFHLTVLWSGSEWPGLKYGGGWQIDNRQVCWLEKQRIVVLDLEAWALSPYKRNKTERAGRHVFFFFFPLIAANTGFMMTIERLIKTGEWVQHLWQQIFLCQSLLESRKEPHLPTIAGIGMHERFRLLLGPFWFAQHILANKVESTPVSSGRGCSAFLVLVCGPKPWQDISLIFTAFAGRWAVSCHYQGVGSSHPSWNEEVWQGSPPERWFQEELESVTSGPCPSTLVEPTAVPLTFFFFL